ncbi:DUF6502 family protein [Inmirania thermothiophila]|uniref:Uncharacterized protein n=1 Tax=Inmirania thermothiophila TaxID=1750597 RepID=A0A3N1Y8Z2_9GAMM|nr:DUF6502 family protein [Inmirania thermothiophila]ROR35011.1 hypothetical protein EDC57_0928 [Inmirania thermothiophila]
MSNDVREAISDAVLRLLRPLVRILLRNGVSFKEFAELAKWVFVDVAAKEFGIPGRKQTNSRISVITGLTRKEVLRIQRLPGPRSDETEKRYNRAARVIAGWVRDHRFADETGRPAVLPFDGEGASFSALVRRYSGDIPPRAILDELVRVGAVERTADGAVRLLTKAYVPRTGEVDKLGILGTDVALLIATIDHNLRHEPPATRFQRKVLYDNLPAEVLPKLRALVEERGQGVLEELDQWLAAHDRDVNPHAEGTGRKVAGVGIYYFEEDYATSPVADRETEDDPR